MKRISFFLEILMLYEVYKATEGLEWVQGPTYARITLEALCSYIYWIWIQ